MHDFTYNRAADLRGLKHKRDFFVRDLLECTLATVYIRSRLSICWIVPAPGLFYGYKLQSKPCNVRLILIDSRPARIVNVHVPSTW